MKLVAIYIHENEHGIKEQIINFGGEYFYEVKVNKENNTIDLDKKQNKKFIQNFYSKNEKLKLVTAIVGRNGSGKTSLLKTLIDSRTFVFQGQNILIFEEKIDNKTKSVYRSNKALNVNPSKGIFAKEYDQLNVESIYYSPHLDEKEYLGIDLSLNTIIKNDLQNVELLNLDGSNRNLTNITAHYLSNFKRSIEFYRPESKISKVLFHFNLPQAKNISLYLTGASKVFENNFAEIGSKIKHLDNVPIEVNSFFQALNKKIFDEYAQINKDYSTETKIKDSRLEIQKYRALLLLISIMLEVMDSFNTYYSQSTIEFPNVETELNAEDLFFYFLDNYKFQDKPISGKDLNESFLPVSEIKSTYLLVKKLIFDNYEKNIEWHRSKISNISTSDAIRFIELDIKIKEKLKYYHNPLKLKNGYIADPMSFINLEWTDRVPSSGETIIFNLFSRLWSVKSEIDNSENKHFLLFLDEADAGFHPEWKKKFIDIITQVTPLLFEKEDITFQIIFTTHDPLTLSDVLNYNIIYLDKKEKETENHKIFSTNDSDRPNKSFAANITDLLSDSYFVGDGLIGDFAKNKIRETIDWLNNKKMKTWIDRHTKKIEKSSLYFKKLIENIDEPIVKNKLSEMYDEKMKTTFELELLEKQKEEIEARIKKIKK